MTAALKKAVLRFGEKLGYRIEKIPKASMPRLSRRQITDLDNLVRRSSRIPGMLSREAGKFLYALCYMQSELGDVVEVGSWQGYSTSFLGQAVKDSGNGRLVAIDHFQGNPGKESYYVVKDDSLSDLKENFLRNMNDAALTDHITLLDMPNDRAAEELSAKQIRFLFIDGDHTQEGVQKDIDLFFPLLVPGAVVVFDDFTDAFPGLVKALDGLLGQRDFDRAFAFHKTLVLKCPREH